MGNQEGDTCLCVRWGGMGIWGGMGTLFIEKLFDIVDVVNGSTTCRIHFRFYCMKLGHQQFYLSHE